MDGNQFDDKFIDRQGRILLHHKSCFIINVIVGIYGYVWHTAMVSKVTELGMA